MVEAVAAQAAVQMQACWRNRLQQLQPLRPQSQLAAHSIFSGLMTHVAASLSSSSATTCAVNVEQGLSFTCGFLSNHTEAESVGVLCANRHEVEGSNDETAQTKTSAYPTNGRDVPWCKHHLVVVTSMGIVSLHRFNLMEGTSQLENQQFLLEQAE